MAERGCYNPKSLQPATTSKTLELLRAAGADLVESRTVPLEVDVTTESLKETIKRELAGWLREDPEFRAYVLELTRREYAGRADTEDQFYAILAELRRDREAQARKWEEQDRKWDEHQAEQRADPWGGRFTLRRTTKPRLLLAVRAAGTDCGADRLAGC